MTTKYYLNQDILPTIPTPHDSIITAIDYNSEFLILKFEEDISRHDSIKLINPNAKSLNIRVHLLDPDFETYKWEQKCSLIKGEGFILTDNRKVFGSKFKKMEYLYHYVGYNSIIIQLFQSRYIILNVQSDFIEFEWIEK